MYPLAVLLAVSLGRGATAAPLNPRPQAVHWRRRRVRDAMPIASKTASGTEMANPLGPAAKTEGLLARQGGPVSQAGEFITPG